MRVLCITIVFCLFTALSIGQNRAVSKKTFLREGNYFFEKQAYHEAIPAFEKALKVTPNHIQGRFRLGKSHFYIRNYVDAKAELQKVVALTGNNQTEQVEYAETWYYLGQSLKYLGQYEEAKRNFMKFLKIKNRSPKIKDLKRRAANEVRSCDFALQQTKGQYVENYRVIRMEGEINGPYTEFSPRYYRDNIIIFAALKADSLIKVEPKDPSAALVRLYESKVREGKTTEPVPFYGFNDDFFHTSNGTFSADGKHFYFTRCAENRYGKIICAIYESHKKSNIWDKPKKMGPGINLKGYTSTQPSISRLTRRKKTYEVLYFVSDRPGGKGGLDIWYAPKGKNGQFETPRNCNTAINTKGNEISPYYSNSTGELYYSSDYRLGLGGYDVFKAKGLRKSWKKSENLGMPVNSSYDDTYFSYYPKLHKGLMTSNRPTAALLGNLSCCEDIYSVIEKDIRELKGIVQDKDSTGMPLAGASIGFFRDSNQHIVRWAEESDGTGIFHFSHEKEKSYTLVMEKAGYHRGIFSLDSILQARKETDTVLFLLSRKATIKEDKRKEENIASLTKKPDKALDEGFMEKQKSFDEKATNGTFQKGDVFTLEHLYFDTNQTTLKTIFYKKLETLLSFMKANPTVRIEISGYTDDQGSERYNLILSRKRAEAVMKHLNKSGIKADRMVPIGYGEANPIADNTTEKGRQMNRRTEIKILEK